MLSDSNLDWQTYVALLFVASAVLVVLKTFFVSLKSTGQAGHCGSCSGCQHASTDQNDRVELIQLKKK